MARVPLSPQRVIIDTSSSAAISNAGALARGVGAVADFAVDKLQERKRDQEQIEVIKRTSEFQNQAYDMVEQHREKFKNDPDASIDTLNESLRNLGEGFKEGLSTNALQSLTVAQEGLLGRYGLDQKEWASKQNDINTANNIMATGKSYLESAAKAGNSADFNRLNDIIEDVSTLSQQGSSVFTPKQNTAFSEDIKQGIIENFSDALMYNNPNIYLNKLNEGFFDEVLDAKERSERKSEAQELIKTSIEQADFQRNLNYMNSTPSVAKAVSNGDISFNDLDELVAADKISPEFAESKRRELTLNKANVKTDPEKYANIKAKIQRITEKATTTVKEDGTSFTKTEQRLAPDALKEALLLQDEIAKMQANAELNSKDGNTLAKMLQLSISNTVAADGLSDLTSVNHYQDAMTTFEEAGFEGRSLMDAMRAYTIGANEFKLDEKNDALAADEAGAGSKIMSFLGSQKSTDKLLADENTRSQIRASSKKIAFDIITGKLIEDNPSLKTFQGDLPNRMLDSSASSKTLLNGGNVKADSVVAIPSDSIPSFDSVDSLNEANLPVGTIVIVDGVKGRVTE